MAKKTKKAQKCSKNVEKTQTAYQIAREEAENFTKRQRRVSVRSNVYRVSH